MVTEPSPLLRMSVAGRADAGILLLLLLAQSASTVLIIIIIIIIKCRRLHGNVPSKLRGCAAAHVAKKRRAAVSNCRAVISNVISVMYI